MLTHEEIAEILTKRGYPVTKRIVWHLEKQALRKIAEHSSIRAIAEELGILRSDSLQDD